MENSYIVYSTKHNSEDIIERNFTTLNDIYARFQEISKLYYLISAKLYLNGVLKASK